MHQHVDVLITAAGVGGGGAVHQLEMEEWRRVIDINLTGTYLSCKYTLPSMLERKQGSIVTIASVEGIEGTEGGSCYNASKGGVILLTRNMANDYGRRGIRANAICPGFIDTPMLRSHFEHEIMAPYLEQITQQHKLGRLGKPEEIASAALFLASSDASFVTGCALPVDGGFTAGHSTGMVKLLGLD
jgi:NAD(P)-dependent dehydrogenase (short-subunit alcohol dehydrogenase family)